MQELVPGSEQDPVRPKTGRTGGGYPGSFTTQRGEVNKLATVELQTGESQERLLKRFRKKVQKERILSTVKRKRFFVSKSEQRRIALRKAKRRERRRRWKMQRRYSRYA